MHCWLTRTLGSDSALGLSLCACACGVNQHFLSLSSPQTPLLVKLLHTDGLHWSWQDCALSQWLSLYSSQSTCSHWRRTTATSQRNTQHWTSTVPSQTPLPRNLELFNGKCYYFSTDRMNWNSSRDNCTSLGGHLVIIESDGEQKFLSEKAWNITQEANVMKEEEIPHWIGLTDAVTEGTWLWVDGTPLIGNVKAKFWATRTHDGVEYGKEPDDYKGEDLSGEDCAELHPLRNSYEIWGDSLCTKQYKRICETKAVIA
ncbi:C-type lectin domain family 4 member D-like isoform X3 [Polyodon spathula]|uniref:C-type lectin domain family 4 member D-like isoform X3 n=1 Tax=Polyodon spathula TaxID=7913 RepID=UPI001B7DEC9A|nr:C-type lectin domain family 4 member D-like isoform X3 [Polyodon spathula]